MKNQESLKLVQLTDCHLLADPAADLLGIPTDQSLQAVIKHIADHHNDADAILVTGDLSQDGSQQSYHCLEKALKPLSAPSFWIPGNHDCSDTLAQFCTDKPLSEKHIVGEYWQILMLDSQVSGQVYGELSRSELAFLERSIAQYPNHHTLVSLHHHPIPIKSQWMDKIGLRNGDQLCDLLAPRQTQNLIIFGHVHQEIDQQEQDFRALATPSTCIQFRSNSDQFELDTIQPGYRWITLHSNGDIETQVERLTGSNFRPDLLARGY